MNNDNQDLDNLLRQRFEQYTPEPDETTWAHIADKLPPPAPRPKHWKKAALLLLLLVGISTWFYNGISDLTPTPSKALTETKAAFKKSVANNPQSSEAKPRSNRTNPRLGRSDVSEVARRAGVGKADEVAKTNEIAKASKSALEHRRNPRSNETKFHSNEENQAKKADKAIEIEALVNPSESPLEQLRSNEVQILNLDLLSSIPLKTNPASLTVPAIQNQPTVPTTKRKTPLEWWITATPFLTYQQVEAVPQPEIGYLINMTPYSPLSAQRVGGQVQLNVRKKWNQKWSGQLGAGYAYLPQWIDYEWFTGDFKVTETPKNGLLIERNAKTYAERSALHLGSISGALRYRLGEKSGLPTLEAGGTWQYDFKTKRALTHVSMGLDWQHKRLSFGPRVAYYLSQFEDGPRFLQINPYTVGASVALQIR